VKWRRSISWSTVHTWLPTRMVSNAQWGTSSNLTFAIRLTLVLLSNQIFFLKSEKSLKQSCHFSRFLFTALLKLYGTVFNFLSLIDLHRFSESIFRFYFYLNRAHKHCTVNVSTISNRSAE